MIFWTSVWVGVSLAIFVAGLLLLPVMVVRIPPDYFAADRRPRSRFQQRHPAVRIAFVALKNLLGGVLLLGGLLMAVPFVPGPGLVSFVVGLALLDIPGKRAIERKLIGLPKVLSMMNRLRARYGHPPLLPPAGRQFA